MRITKVTTRNGDSGKTGLARGGSVYKNDAIIHALGDIDELKKKSMKIHHDTENVLFH